MNSNFNLPPGVTLADIDPPQETQEEFLQRTGEELDRAHERYVDDQLFACENGEVQPTEKE